MLSKKLEFILVLVIVLTFGISAYSGTPSIPKEQIDDLLSKAQKNVDEGNLEKAVELLSQAKTKISKTMFQIVPGKDKFQSKDWAMEITHYTPNASEARYENKYSFAIWLKAENLSSQDLSSPSFTPYSLNPEGWQIEGYCSVGNQEILAGATKKIQCSYNTPKDNFVAGEHKFIIKVNTGTYSSPKSYQLEHTFNIGSPND